MSGQQAENTLHENAIGWALILAVTAVLVWVFWYFFDTEVRNIVRWIRYGEMWLLSFFIDDAHNIPFQGEETNWQQGFEFTGKWQAEVLTYNHLAYMSALAMQPLKFVFTALCAMGAIWCMFWGPNTRYGTALNLDGLIQRQSNTFPVIAPFVKFNPSQQPPRPPGSPVPAELPLFAEPLGPEEWIAYNNIPIPDGNMNENAIKKAFMKQLKGRWKGPKALAPYQQILLATFCLKASRKRDQADVFLGRLALCWSADKGLRLKRDRSLLKEARKILQNKELSGKTLKMANRHAFVTTALMRALDFARDEGGVLAPATFVWLRGHDRTLWYPLNNMGRHSYHMEALGAMSHYKAEKMTNRPIPIPKMEHACETIVEYMRSKRARPIPQLDYSYSKKRSVKKAAG